MVTAKLAFVLVQVGSNLWVNPMQLQGVAGTIGADCKTVILVTSQNGTVCSDWPLERVKEALAPSAVAKAMEAAR